MGVFGHGGFVGMKPPGEGAEPFTKIVTTIVTKVVVEVFAKIVALIRLLPRLP